VKGQQLVAAVAARGVIVGNPLIDHIHDSVAFVVLHDDTPQVGDEPAIGKQAVGVVETVNRETADHGEAAPCIQVIVARLEQCRRFRQRTIVRCDGVEGNAASLDPRDGVDNFLDHAGR
jgi:hypothetical protein